MQRIISEEEYQTFKERSDVYEEIIHLLNQYKIDWEDKEEVRGIAEHLAVSIYKAF